jgi:hypothetical protein
MNCSVAIFAMIGVARVAGAISLARAESARSDRFKSDNAALQIAVFTRSHPEPILQPGRMRGKEVKRFIRPTE